MHLIRPLSASPAARPKPAPRLPRSGIACLVLLVAVCAQSAAARPCPPGTRGTCPHCMPAHAPQHRQPPYAHSTIAHAAARTPDTHQHASAATAAKIVDSSGMKPDPGTPRARRSAASQSHAIIFVGGRAQGDIGHGDGAINSQPVPPGHAPGRAAINSQPVPPGRPARHLPPRPATQDSAGH